MIRQNVCRESDSGQNYCGHNDYRHVDIMIICKTFQTKWQFKRCGFCRWNDGRQNDF